MLKRIVQIALVLFLLIATASLRFAGIGKKPLHHDESLFAYYGHQVAENCVYDAGGYSERYDAETISSDQLRFPLHHPLLHGPFLMQTLGGLLHYTRWVGIGSPHEDAVIRWPSALSMLALIPLIFAFGRRLSTPAKWAIVLLFAVSPTLWYYARFCRNDLLFSAATLLTVLAWTHALSGLLNRKKNALARNAAHAFPLTSNDGWLIAALAATALTIGIKENAIFLIFNACTFACVWLALNIKKSRDLPEALFGKGKIFVWIAGIAFGILLLEFVFTNAFLWETSFAQMYSDAVHYWSGQNKEHRLYGEFHYYLLRLLLYEPLGVFVVFPVALVVLIKYFKKTPVQLVFAVGITLGFFALIAGSFFIGIDSDSGEQLPLGKMLHMSRPWHLAMAACVAWFTLSATVFLITRHRVFGAWLCWWAGFSFLEYNYAGEKVPWIAVHIVLPMLMMTGYLIGNAWQRLAAKNKAQLWRTALVCSFGLYLIANLAQGYRLCFQNNTNPAELLVYNHTQYPFRDIALEMRSLAESTPPDASPRVMMQGEGVWPMQWYLRGTNHLFSGDTYLPVEINNVQMLICSDAYLEQFPELRDDFMFEDISFRRHWFPDPLHLFTPLRRVIVDLDGRVKPKEAWTSSDRRYADSIRWQYGYGAWKSFYRYIVYREMWGNPEYLAQPMTIPLGRRISE